MSGKIVRKIVRDKDLEGYVQTANVAKIFSDPIRLELLDALAQSARTVNSLARVCEIPLKNVSHHLQKLLAAGMVDKIQLGRRAVYSISNSAVLAFWSTLRKFSEDICMSEDTIEAEQFGEGITTEHLARLLRHKRVVVIDLRPTEEYSNGHLPGAISVPEEKLKQEIGVLPRGKPVIAFCRGSYCKIADRAVDMLRASGYEALRCADGIVEWQSTGNTIEKVDTPFEKELS